MYHIIHIKDRKYIYFPLSQTFFNYTEELENKLKNDSAGNKQIQKVIIRERKLARVIPEILQKDAVVDHQIGGCEINIFHGCNMKCRYCFAAGGDHGKSGRMSKERVKTVIDFMIAHASKPILEAVIIGGEPFLDFDTFKEVVSYGKRQALQKDRKVYFSTISNGININSDISNFIKKEEVALTISLDSKEKEVNDFLRPTRSGISAYQYIMNHLLFYEGADGVNVTITPFNLNISEIALFLFDKLNVKNIHFSEVFSDEESLLFTEADIDKLIAEYDKLADILLQKFRKKEYVDCYPLTTYLDKIHKQLPLIKPCSVLKNKCAFSPDGKIYPCDVLMYDEYCIGDIESGFDNRRINELRKINQDDSNCQECWARYLCGGECLSTKMWKNPAQRLLRCRVKKHICKLKLYIYENIVKDIGNIEKIVGGLSNG